MHKDHVTWNPLARSRARLTFTGAALTALMLAGAMPADAKVMKHHPRAGIGMHTPPKPSGASPYHVGVAPFPAGIEKPSREVLLSVGEGEIVNLPTPMNNIWLSNPGIADVYVNNSHQIHLFSKGVGETTLFATSASGAVVYAAKVKVVENINSIDAMLHAAFPDNPIHVTLAGQMAVITGTVATPLDATQAESLVKTALNPGIAPNSDAQGKFMVINRLHTATPLQINLRVRIAEVSRSFTKAIGTNLTTYSSGTSGILFGMSRGGNQGTVTPVQTPTQATSTGLPVGGAQFGIAPNLAGSTAIALGGQALGLDILGSLDLGEQVGLVTTLAEPNLTALSGESAQFLAGGQYPIPMSGGLGTQTVEFKNYGVSLSFTGTVLANGNISLKVSPEVSQLDTSHAVTIGSIVVPGLTVRSAQTVVELGSGQSFMIAGLMDNSATHTATKLPGAGDVPVLGALFRSTSFQKGETELVIVVTPYLVRPVSDADIKLPTDGMQNPTEINRVLGNMLTQSTPGEPPRPGPTSAPAASAAPSGKPSHSARANPPANGDDTGVAPGFTMN